LIEVVTPSWPLPKGIVAYTSTRRGGVSKASYATANVGAHVGDDQHVVSDNRSRLPYADRLVWLNQTHSNQCVSLPFVHNNADASLSSDNRFFCAIMTADCVPVLLCHKTGRQVGAIHAGLECGVIGERAPGMDMVSFGPTITGAHSPDERVEISSVEKFWDLLLELLAELAEA